MNLLLLLGLLVLVVTIYDFFYTTLSGSGASFLTKLTSQAINLLVQKVAGILGRKVYMFSGLLLNLIMMLVWLVMIWTGVFLIFSYDPAGVVNSSGRVATHVERLYFTGYTLSTLGLGNFKPVTPFFEILTSICSFFGFIFFTTTMTYFISLSSSVVQKRTLALTINNVGKNPAEIIKRLKEYDKNLVLNFITDCKVLLERHTINHQAYPIIHYVSNYNISSSLSLNLVSLDESLSILLTSDPDKNKNLEFLRNAIDEFYKNINQKYGEEEQDINTPQFSLSPTVVNFNISGYNEYCKSEEAKKRRRIQTSLLSSEGYTWENIYPKSVLV